MSFVQNQNLETENQHLRPLREEDERMLKMTDNLRSQKFKPERKLECNVCTNFKNFNFIAILASLIAVLLVLITLINSYIILKTWSAINNNQQNLKNILDNMQLINYTRCTEYTEPTVKSQQLSTIGCPVCGTTEPVSIISSAESKIITEVPQVQVLQEIRENSTKKDPLSLLTELVQRGAKFTCDIVCQIPLIVKSVLKVNSESEVWEGIGDGNMSAKQNAAFKALKDLYPPHILADVFYQTRNDTVSDCFTEPVQAAANSSIKINKRC